jgi:hypothetical protein
MAGNEVRFIDQTLKIRIEGGNASADAVENAGLIQV